MCLPGYVCVVVCMFYWLMWVYMYYLCMSLLIFLFFFCVFCPCFWNWDELLWRLGYLCKKEVAKERNVVVRRHSGTMRLRLKEYVCVCACVFPCLSISCSNLLCSSPIHPFCCLQIMSNENINPWFCSYMLINLCLSSHGEWGCDPSSVDRG